MTTATTATTTAVDRLLAVVTGARPAGDDIYAADAELDAVVPGWRFAIRGATAIADQLAEWFRCPAALEELECRSTERGAVLTYTVTWEEQGVPHAGRHVHVLSIVDDRVVRDQFWCGGRWPAPLLAEMEAAHR
jgi:hypothetical protein